MHYNLALYGILVLEKIKYPIASGELLPPDPPLQRYNTWVSPSPLDQTLILTLPSENPIDPPLHGISKSGS